MHVLRADTQTARDGQLRPGVGAAQTAPAAQTMADSQPPCGGGVAPTHKRGERGNWNSTAHQRLWLIADSCIQCVQSPYRQVYEQGRPRYADALHAQPRVRCGPRGTPAPNRQPTIRRAPARPRPAPDRQANLLRTVERGRPR
jgi:hypothetical protein